MKADKPLFKDKLLSVNNLQQLPNDVYPRTLAEVKTDKVLIFGGITAIITSCLTTCTMIVICDISYQNQKYNGIEHCYQHSKALMFGDNRAAASILRATGPGDQKFLAKTLKDSM